MTSSHNITETLPLAIQGAYQPNDYDVEHKTVNQRIPSGYASRVGYKLLQASKEAAVTVAEILEGYDKQQEALDEVRRLNIELAHASQTIQAIKMGIINRLDAPPAKAVMASDVFRYAVLTANAAPTLAQTDKELFELGLCPDGRILPRAGSEEAEQRQEEKRRFSEAQQAAVDADSKALTERARYSMILQRRRELKRQGILRDEIPGQLEAFDAKPYEK